MNLGYPVFIEAKDDGGGEWYPACKKTGCWFVGGDDMTGALHDLQLQLSPPLPSSVASITPANPGSLGKWPLKRRQRDK